MQTLLSTRQPIIAAIHDIDGFIYRGGTHSN